MPDNVVYYLLNKKTRRTQLALIKFKVLDPNYLKIIFIFIINEVPEN